MTKFVQLHPLKSKYAPEIAYQLLDIFSIFRAPSILQSDNEREFVNPAITELSEIRLRLKLVHGKPRHSQSQGQIERANRDIEDMFTTWLQSNSKIVPIMEASSVRHLETSKTSNLPDDVIEDIFTEEELAKVVSGENGDEQNNFTEDPVEEIHVEIPDETSNDLG